MSKANRTLQESMPLQVSAIMTREPICVSLTASLDCALRTMDKQGIRNLPVVEDGKPVGVLSDRLLLEATGWLPSSVHACRGIEAAEGVPLQVSDLELESLNTVAPEDPIATAAVELLYRGVGCLPVVEAGVLVGLLSEVDLLTALVSGRISASRLQAAVPLVSDCMTEAPVTTHWYSSLAETTKLFRDNQIRHLPILEGGQLVGIVSDRDLRRTIGVGRSDDRVPVEEFMTRNPLTIESKAELTQAAKLMVKRKVSALPVVDDYALVGILSLSDLLRHCLHMLQAEQETQVDQENQAEELA